MPDCIPHSSLPSTYREDKGIPLYYVFKADETKFHFKSESQVQKGKDRLRGERKKRNWVRGLNRQVSCVRDWANLLLFIK